ncbi:hypothetical protein BZA05DRAFT_393422 [Tricharina praecox]|uniref:uncharacterized protein n=1 Tax=Tricharina praecox TaxID=43433 RepID=UPI00221EC82A|nr:uncharacterized protein BZA05DRAFT_393422 [Tricharina praecox]KAI5854162.1 hypothetical protein BZA05DRAFT_393422 [Tricharina praecox]
MSEGACWLLLLLLRGGSRNRLAWRGGVENSRRGRRGAGGFFCAASCLPVCPMGDGRESLDGREPRGMVERDGGERWSRGEM